MNNNEIYMNKTGIKNNTGDYTNITIPTTLNEFKDTIIHIAGEEATIFSWRATDFSTEEIIKMAREHSFAITPEEIVTTLSLLDEIANKHLGDRKVAERIGKLNGPKR